MELKKALINGKILSGYQNYENHALLIDGRQISGIVSNTAIPAAYQKMRPQRRVYLSGTDRPSSLRCGEPPILR